MQKLFNQCPSCGAQLIITECKCPACQLQMRGEFQPGQISALSDEAWTFIKVFLLRAATSPKWKECLASLIPLFGTN